MDVIYLRRFNKDTDLEALQDEAGSLSSQHHDLERQWVDVCPIASYSGAQRIANKLAIVKAKYAYIQRLCENKRKEVKEVVKVQFPIDYYGEL